MTKKEYIISLLSLLGKDALSISDDILFLIKSNKVNDQMIDSLYDILKEAVKSTRDGIKRNKISKWLQLLNKLKSIEEKQKISDQQDTKELDEMLKNI